MRGTIGIGTNKNECSKFGSGALKLQDLVDHLSTGETLDVKELIAAITNDENLETIYEMIKDTSN